VTIGVAGVDLVMLDLRLLLAAVDTVCPDGPFFSAPADPWGPASPPAVPPRSARPPAAPADSGAAPGRAAFLPAGATVAESAPSGRKGPEHGLMKLALTLVNLLHEVLERQAVRRMGNGTLTPAQIEAVGLALYAQAVEIARLRQQFGLSEADLTLRLSASG
jgi:hypothetical protein